MKKQALLAPAAAIAGLAAAVAALPALAAAAAGVAGAWKVVGSIGAVPVEIVCTFTEAEQKLTGACRNDEVGELTLTGETDGSAAKWRYSVNYQGQQFTVSYDGMLRSATEMQGSIAVDGNPSGSFTGTKQ